MVETEETQDDTEEIKEETITFLYKLSSGACPKSYGFNAAKLAGIPRDVTTRAQVVARTIERDAAVLRTCKDVFSKKSGNASDLRAMLSNLSI